jgi:single-strand DNA-binding protein
MNICSFMGRLTREPEYVQLQNGKNVINFSMAVRNPNTGNKDKADTTFIDCVAWEGTADLINKYFKKGSRILVHTSAKTDNWIDKDTGKNRYKIKFLVQKFWYVDQKQEDAYSNIENVDEEEVI